MEDKKTYNEWIKYLAHTDGIFNIILVRKNGKIVQLGKGYPLNKNTSESVVKEMTDTINYWAEQRIEDIEVVKNYIEI